MVFLHKDSTINLNDKIDKCFQCNIVSSSIITDTTTGERICSGCGIVYERSIVDYDIIYESKYKGLLHKEVDLIYSSFSSPTSINKLNIDCNGGNIPFDQIYAINRLRRMDRFSHGDRNYARNLHNASNALKLLKDRLSFSDALIEVAFSRYIKILKSNLIKGRSIKGFVVATVYSACRELNIPRTLSEIADTVNINKTLARKCYNILVEQLDLNRPAVQSNVYLARVANNTGISNKTLLKAIDLWSKIKDHPLIQGKKPLALSMAILYLTSIRTGERITKTKISSSCNMSKVTLNKRLLEIVKILKETE